MDSLTLDLDFTGITPSSGLGFLPAGNHTAPVVDINHYEDSNRLYVYMDTEGVRHRESFSLAANANGERKGMSFLMNFLISAGVPSDAIANRPVKNFPLHNLEGKTVYFAYTPPSLDEKGAALQGSYPSYKFTTQDRFNAIQSISEVAVQAPFEVEVSAPTNGKVAPAVVANAPASDDFDFLTNG